MGKPAARMGDQTVHGGTVVVGFPTVLIGGKPAARIGDMHVCPMVTPGTPPIPHIGGPISMGVPTVLIGNMPAACMGDMAVCVGPPDTIAIGCPTVLIGMAGGGGAGAAGAAAGASAASFVVKTKRHGGLFGAIVGGIVGAIVGAVKGRAIGGLPGAIVGGIVRAVAGAAARYGLTHGKDEPEVKKILTEREADVLFKKLSDQPHIPFDYPVDCCYSRAHEMCRIIEEDGIKCQKVWYYAKGYPTVSIDDMLTPVDKKGSSIKFPDPDTGKDEPVTWTYHVAPTVKVKQSDGSKIDMVMDPSISDKPLTVKEWQDKQGVKDGAKIKRTDSKPYFRNPDGSYRIEDPNFEKTKKQFEKHQENRDDGLQSKKRRKGAR